MLSSQPSLEPERLLAKPTTDGSNVPTPNGSPVRQRDFVWQTTNLTKDGSGTWTITPAGRDVLARISDPTAFYQESARLFAEWKKERDRTRRRAWLVRGSSVSGVNLVPEWLTGGFTSLAASQLRPISAGIGLEELEAQATEDYSHLTRHETKAKVEEIVSFVSRMRPGDLVVTSSDERIYIGDLTGDWSHEESEGGRSNLRRGVSWRNADAPVAYGELPAPLPARLQAGGTLVDLTADLA